MIYICKYERYIAFLKPNNIDIRFIFSSTLISKFIIILFLIFFSSSNFTFSQKQQTLKFSQLSLKEGLSQSVVFQTIQDKEGLLWIGTQDGLNKYDGYKFTVFRNNPKDPKSLSNNSVWSILEDSNDVLWIGTRGGGLNKFDKKTERFTIYKNDLNDSGSISSNSVYTLFKDKSGCIWIGTEGGGLNQFDRQTENFIVYNHNPIDANSLSNNSVYSIAEDDDGNLWIGTNGGGLNKFDRKTQHFTSYKNIQNDHFSLSNNRIRSIFKDEDGILWIGTNGGGLNKFDIKTGKFISFIHDPNNPESISNNNVYSILSGGKDLLWIATYEGGLNLFSKVTGKFSAFKKDPLKFESLSSNTVLSLFEDGSNTLWIGTYGGGLSKLSRFNSKFTIIRNDPVRPNSLSSSAIRSIFVDHTGTLWIGTRGGGLNKYVRNTNSYIAYRNSPTDLQSFYNNSVYSIIEDKSGVIWVGTFGGGLNRFDKNTGKFYGYVNNPMDQESLSNNNIYRIYEDSSEDIWIGTDGGGLNRFNKKTGKFKSYQNDPKDTNSLSNNIVIAIYEDKKGTLWIGTRGGGLNMFDRKTEQFYSFKNDPNNLSSISNNNVLSIIEDENETLWIGTDGGGINKVIINQDNSTKEEGKINRLNISFSNYTIEDGLPNNCIYGIIKDGKGNLWLSTNNGICKFTPQENGPNKPLKKAIVRSYDLFDGLPSNEFNTGAYFWNNGTIYFGSIDGLLIFNPDSIINNPFKPAIAITGFQLFNKEVSILQDENIEDGPNNSRILRKNSNYCIPQSITHTKELTLSYNDKVFTFEFAALDYSVPEKNQYAYKMEGFDKDWNNIGTRRYATYTNLSHGEYIFRVKGSNGDGVWNENGASIKLIILPPFWKTTWFRILVILIVFSSIVYYIKWRERKLKKDKDILEVTVKERTIQLKEANEELNQQNEEISSQRDNLQIYINELRQKNEEIMAQRDEIQKKNIIIEQKNNNITASITYAENIQHSILPEIETIQSVFPESFVLYKPKDIVSGDFFWFYEMNEIVYFAVIDCTGHGVPGALMSVMGFAFLRKALHETQIHAPSNILNNLSSDINSTVRKANRDSNIKDGMDIALCAFHKDTLMLEYAGAHNPMFIQRDNKITKFKPDNHPIGDSFTNNFSSYSNISYQLIKGDIIYLFTDGVIDQFGGPKNQKFSSKQLESILINNSMKPMSEQCLIVNESIENWKVGVDKIFDQTDDITMMGIRIT